MGDIFDQIQQGDRSKDIFDQINPEKKESHWYDPIVDFGKDIASTVVEAPVAVNKMGRGLNKALGVNTSGYDENLAYWEPRVKKVQDEYLKTSEPTDLMGKVNKVMAHGVGGAIKYLPALPFGVAGMASQSALETYDTSENVVDAATEGLKSATSMKLMGATTGKTAVKSVGIVSGVSGVDSFVTTLAKTGDVEQALKDGAESAVQMAAMDIANRGMMPHGGAVHDAVYNEMRDRGYDQKLSSEFAQRAQQVFDASPKANFAKNAATQDKDILNADAEVDDILARVNSKAVSTITERDDKGALDAWFLNRGAAVEPQRELASEEQATLDAMVAGRYGVPQDSENKTALFLDPAMRQLSIQRSGYQFMDPEEQARMRDVWGRQPGVLPTDQAQPPALTPPADAFASLMSQPRENVTPYPQSRVDEIAHEAATSPLNERPEPTPNMTRAGNYKKGHVNIHGLDIAIENPKGSIRFDKENTPPTWQTEMRDHYGYIKGTVGKDKDHLDVFIRPGMDVQQPGDKVFVVDQIDPKTKKLDEHKIMFGYDTLDQAREAYLRNYDESGPSRIGGITESSVDNFKQWVREGDTKKPFLKVEEAKPVEDVTFTDLQQTGIGHDVNSKDEIIVMKGEGTHRAIRSKDGTWRVQTDPKNVTVDGLTMREAMDELVEMRGSKMEEPEKKSTTPGPDNGNTVTEEVKGGGKNEVAEKEVEVAHEKGMTTFDVTGRDSAGNETTVQVRAKDAQEAMAKADNDNKGFDSESASEVTSEKKEAKQPEEEEDEFDRIWREEQEKRQGKKEGSAPKETDPAKETAPATPKAVKLPKKPKAPQPKSERTPDEALKSAKENAEKAFQEGKAAIIGILKGVKDPNKLSSGLTFDDETYQQIKPHLTNMWKAAKDAAVDSAEALRGFVQRVMDEIGSAVGLDPIKPFARKFYEEAKNGAIILDEKESARKGDTKDVEETERHEPGPRSDVPDVRDGRGRPGDETGAEEKTPGGQDLRRDGSDAERDEGRGGERREVAKDYVITDADKLGEGGEKTKARGNIAAIRIAKDILETGRAATPEEREALVKYVGWGGISQIFNEAKAEWDKDREELKSLLTPEEYAAARRSTQDAHYTSIPIIRAIYKALERLGYTGGRVLEPSVGVGHFFGLMPEDMKSSSRLFGTELDPLTTIIAKTLYPSATIANAPFQDLHYENGYFDLAVGNPPFGATRITDTKEKELSGLSIHNYFFAKAMKKLREGGIQAMVVSSSLMDKKDPADRQRLAEGARLLGAIRLPSDAFKKNAGTEVTTDILFFQKLKPGEVADTKWQNLDVVTGDGGHGYRVNEYFAKNPEMMLGDPSANKLHPGEVKNGVYDAIPGLKAKADVNFEEALNKAIEKLPQNVFEAQDGIERQNNPNAIIPKPGEAKVWGYFVRDGKVYQRTPDKNGEMASELALVGEANPKPLEGKDFERVKGMLDIRDAYRRLQRAELSDEPEGKINLLRKALNRVYDDFVREHGYISSDVNKRVMRGDLNDFPNLLALEGDYDKGVSAATAKKYGIPAREASATKAAIFTKRLLVPYHKAVKADTAYDALMISLQETGRIDIPRLEELTGKRYAEVLKELGDSIFTDPVKGHVTSDEYLSGNVKKKLKQAQEKFEKTGDSQWQRNIEALKKVQPGDVSPDGITVRLGSHWIPAEVYKEFVEHLLGGRTDVKYVPETAKWIIDTKSVGSTVANEETWGTQQSPASDMIPKIFDGKTIEIKSEDANGNKYLDKEATAAANAKANEIIEKFKEWIWQDGNRREKLTRIYNDTMNTDVKRAWDGSHLITPGKVDDKIITLKPHQKNVIWRLIQQGKGLIDHCVGAGKTFSVTTTAMELRRMGLAKKPMITVPNHLVGQWAKEIKTLYPSANILMITKRDFKSANRKNFIAKIATGDYDAVVIAHSSFGFINPPKDFERRVIQEHLDELEIALREARRAAGEPEDGGGKGGRKDPTVKELEAAKDRFLNRLKELQDKTRDDVLDFDHLGVDALFVDESHEFRSLFYTTRKQRIKGLGNSAGSKKAYDMFIKTQYLLDRNNDRGVYFATGTPISNTMAELYTLQRYLSYQDMKERGIHQFDAWANTFGQEVSDWELDAGGRLKATTRFKKFVNMPELSTLYHDFADVMTLAQLRKMEEDRGGKWPVPKVKGGKPQNLVVERSPEQADFMNWIVHRMESMPDDPRIDNHLYATLHARMAGLDLRLLDPNATDHPGSKVNRAVDEIARVYNKWSDKKGTQLVFCDLSVPGKNRGENLRQAQDEVGADVEPAEILKSKMKKEEADGDDDTVQISADELAADLLGSAFSVYDDLKTKLIKKGISPEEIVFIHDYRTDEKKAELYELMNQGRVRVLIGSTPKMGAGMNVQKKLVALHHLDAPWMPKDLEQREGRIIRQGNEFYMADPDKFEVEIIRYATKQMYDARMWEINEAKAGFTEQFRAGGMEGREMEDVAGESVNAAAMKAEASGNPLIRKEIELRSKVGQLEAVVRSEQSSRWHLEDTVKKAEMAEWQADLEHEILDGIEERVNANKFRASDQKWHIYLGIDNNKPFKAKVKEIPEDASKEDKAALKKANEEAVAANKKAAGEQAASDFAKFASDLAKTAGMSLAKQFGAYRGFSVHIEGNKWGQDPKIWFTLKEPGTKEELASTDHYRMDKENKFSFSPSGFFTRLDNMIDSLVTKEKRQEIDDRKERIKTEAKAAKETLSKPSAKTEELRNLRKEHEEVLAQLSSAGGGNVDEQYPVEERERWEAILQRQRAKRDAKEASQPKKYSAEEVAEGIPFTGRAKRPARKPSTFRKFGAPSWDRDPGWKVSDVDGQTWYGNSNAAVRGEVPDDGYSTSVDYGRFVKSKPGEAIEPAAFAKIKDGNESVWFNDGTEVDAKLYDYIREQHPDVQIHKTEGSHLLGTNANGETVALLMPKRTNEMYWPDKVKEILGRVKDTLGNERGEVVLKHGPEPMSLEDALKDYTDPRERAFAEAILEHDKEVTPEFIKKVLDKGGLGNRAAKMAKDLAEKWQRVNAEQPKLIRPRAVKPIEAKKESDSILARAKSRVMENDFIRGAAHTWNLVANLFAPTRDVAVEQLDSLHQMKGQPEEVAFRLQGRLAADRKIIDGLKPSERVQALDSIRTARTRDEAARRLTQLNPAFERVFNIVADANEELVRRIKEFNPDFKEKEAGHWGFGVQWSKIPGAEEGSGENYFLVGRSLEGNKGWQKKQTLKTISEGLERGGKLRTDNLADIAVNFRKNVEKYLASHEMMEGNINDGTFRYVSKGQRPPEGFVAINDRVAKLFSRVLTRPELKDNYHLFDKVTGEKIEMKDGLPISLEEARDATRENPSLRYEREKGENPEARIRTGWNVVDGKKEIEVNGKKKLVDNVISTHATKEQAEAAAGMNQRVRPRVEKVGALDVGQWYAPEGMARLINNYTSKDIIRGVPVGRAMVQAKNLYTSVELGLSGFHYTTIASELASSKTGLALRKALNGNFQDALHEFTNPADAWTIAKMQEEYVKDPQAWMKNPENIKKFQALVGKGADMDAIIHAAFDGGWKSHQDEELRNSILLKLKEKLKDSDSALKNLSMPVEALDKVTSYLFDVYVPRLKFGMFAKEYQFNMKKYANRITEGDMTQVEVARKTMKFIEDRFGEMNWDNLFFDKTFKTALQLTFRSFTWKLGNLRGLGGALPEQINEIRRAYNRSLKLNNGEFRWKDMKDAELTPKMSWAVSLLAVNAFMAGTTMWALTGVLPQDWLDWIFPHSSKRDPNARLAMPTYIKEIVSMLHSASKGQFFLPTEYVSASMTGLTGRLVEVWRNKDYYGEEVRHKGDNYLLQGADITKHLLPVPFSIQSMARMKEKGEGAKSLISLLGINKAPSWVDQSEAMKLALEYREESGTKRLQTHEQTEHSKLTGRFVGDLRGGDGPGDMMKALKEGKISLQDVKRIRERAKTNPLAGTVKGLTLEQALDVWEVATENEKKLLRPVISAKKIHKIGKSTATQKAELQKRMHEVGFQ
jgi:N12 class adenine-specific DNA methylase